MSVMQRVRNSIRATPGALAHFRLVAVTADGHEKGTPWVTIQRPL